MKKMKRGKGISNNELKRLIVELSELVSKGDTSFDIQVLTTTISEALMERRHIDGLKLVTRISLLSIVSDMGGKSRYDYVNRHVENSEPLDPKEDATALNEMANEFE